MATLLILQTHLGGHSIDHALDLLIGIEVYGNTIPREPEEYGAGMELFQLCFNGLQYRHMFAHFNPFHELAEMFGDNIPGPGYFGLPFLQGLVFQPGQLIYIYQRDSRQFAGGLFHIAGDRQIDDQLVPLFSSWERNKVGCSAFVATRMISEAAIARPFLSTGADLTPVSFASSNAFSSVRLIRVISFVRDNPPGTAGITADLADAQQKDLFTPDNVIFSRIY